MLLLHAVLAQVLANLTTICIIGVSYLMFLLFQDYAFVMLWTLVISQALQGTKLHIMDMLEAMSCENSKRSMLAVFWERAPGLPDKGPAGIRERIVQVILDNGISLFALVGLLSLAYHMLPLPLWFIFLCLLPPVTLLLGILYLVDRRVFLYRLLVSDATLASCVAISAFFLSVTFIILFLGWKSVWEGVSAAQSLSIWVQTQLGDENFKVLWAKWSDEASALAINTFEGLESSYGKEVWWPVVNQTVAMLSNMDYDTSAGSPNWCVPLATNGTLTATPLNSSSSWLNLNCELVLQAQKASEDRGTIGLLSWLLSTFIGDSASIERAGEEGGSIGLLLWASSHMRHVTWEAVLSYGKHAGHVGMGLKKGVEILLTLLSFMMSLGFKFLLFGTGIFYLTSKCDFVKSVVSDLLPIPEELKESVVVTLRSGIEGVFFLPCKIACFHGIITLCTFTALGIQFPFFATFLSVFMSVVPVVPAYLVCVPWVGALLWSEEWQLGLLLFITQYVIIGYIDTKLWREGVRQVHPYLTGLSLFLGFAVFGAQGVLLGPLIICLATLTYSLVGFLNPPATSLDSPFGSLARSNISSPSATQYHACKSGINSPTHTANLHGQPSRRESYSSAVQGSYLHELLHTHTPRAHQYEKRGSLQYTSHIPFYEEVERIVESPPVSPRRPITGPKGSKVIPKGPEIVPKEHENEPKEHEIVPKEHENEPKEDSAGAACVGGGTHTGNTSTVSDSTCSERSVCSAPSEEYDVASTR